MSAHSWVELTAANLLLRMNQAFTWSMTLNMMVDLVPPRRWGLTAAVNEFAGYGG